MRPIIIVLPILLVCPAAALAGNLPSREGACVWTKIARVEQRLQEGEHGPPVPDSGSAVVFDNGGYQVSYEEVGAVNRSHRGDRALMCLVTIPHPCPPGDNRGRVYTTTNLRTMESWTLPDAEHMCGGA
jgi:hypothetical protein